MYQNDHSISYLLYEAKDGQFHLKERFPTKEALLKKLVNFEYKTYPWNNVWNNGNRLLENINMNGNDKDCEGVLRPYILMDNAGHIVDPRTFQDELEALKRLHEQRTFPSHPWWHYNQDHYVPEFRRDPIPGTGSHYPRYYRKVKHWIRSYKQDRIPEQKNFVRHKAMVPNAWDTEPVKCICKNWKHQGKKQHQWE